MLVGDSGPYLAFDAKPELRFGSPEDVEGFVRPFAFDEPLIRGLAVECSDGFELYTDIHHILADGTSLNLLGDEILRAVFGLIPENEMENPSSDLGFLRQLAWERAFRESDSFERAHEVFDSMLQDAEDVCELLPSPDGRDSWQNYMLKVRFEEVSRFCRECEVTPGQLLTAVFAYTLSRFTGDDRALFCLISDGRGSHDLEGAVGMFTKTLPVLVNCSNKDVRSFLHECARISNAVMRSDSYPFRLLAGEYSVTSSVQFQYSHDLERLLEGERHDATPFLLRHDNVADLEFNVGKRSGGFICRVHHSAKYSDSLCDRIVECFDEVLRGMMSCVELKDIGFTSAIDLGFMDRVNETSETLRFADVMDAFECRLRERPDARLVSYRDTVLSYSQGAVRIRALADALRDCGVRAGDAVLCLPERSHWCMLGAFAVLALGAAYVPVEEALPDERVRFMLQDCRAKAVLATRETLDRAKELVEGLDIPEDAKPCVLCASDVEDGISDAAGAASLGAVHAAPRDAAVVLYTSGTTGKPKGVVVPRLALANLAQSFAERTGMSENDVFGLWTAYSFDMHTLALFPVVLAGASCDVVPAEVRLDLEKLDAHYRASGATMTCLTTHVGKLFVSEGFGETLRQVLVIGETLGEFESPERPQMWESYGPTESIALVTTVPVNERSHSSSVGVLNCNTRSYILDAEGRRVPLGAVGDLFLSGYQLAEGYLGRPEATAEAFVRNPFALGQVEYARMYRTGDTARYLPDGTIGFVGRKDSQVKIRGNRIELAEVEALVTAIDFVSQAAVLAVSDGDSKHLVAYAVLNDGVSFENDASLTDEVARRVMEKAPSYMAPGFVVSLDEIPQNANGKVDRRKLPAPDFSAYSEYRAPEDAMEAVVCEAFQHALGVGCVGADDEFQRLGGDSIGAIKVAHELSRAGLDCSAVSVLGLRTPRAIARSLREEGACVSEGFKGLGDTEDGTHTESVSDRILFEYDEESGSFACPLTDT